MELGKQIKFYRGARGLSQEELAEKIYVSRQTISNWENDRSYPDIHSLALMSAVFGISLDTLVKGDLQEMKEKIKEEDIRAFAKSGDVLAVLMLIMVVTPVPLAWFLGWVGVAIWGVWAAVTVWYALKVEKQMKVHDIQTYKEVVAFSEGRRLDEMEQREELAKRPYQKAALSLLAALVALALAAGMILVLK